jgi:hypothetical protein
VKHRLAIVGLSAGLLAGTAAGLAFGIPGLAGAQTDTTTTTAPSSSSTTTPTSSGSDWKEEALAPLVANGTITQAQADAVLGALEAAKPDHGPGHRGGRGARLSLETAATALGMTEDELRAALGDGKTIAAIAQEQGVDVQKVIDALVAEAKAHYDEEVASGDLTRAEADERLTAATERITEAMNRTFTLRHHGPGHDSDESGPDSGSDSGSGDQTTTTTTATS